MFRWDARAALPRIDVPTLVIGGASDIITKPQASRTIAAEIPAARLQLIEGANHMGVIERADVYNQEIRAFAASLGRSSAALSEDRSTFFGAAGDRPGLGVWSCGEVVQATMTR